MTPAQAIEQAAQGKLLPVYVVAGEEALLRDEVVAELRRSSLAGGVAAFNEDKFTAGEVDVETIVAAARTVPMMAPRRFVLLRSAERWEGPDAPTRADAKAGADTSPFDRLAEYAAAPVESSCLVIVATKLDGRRKFVAAARKQGFLVSCDPLDTRSLPAWIATRCAAKGHPIDRDIAERLAAVAGPQLSSLSDAIERLSLYVGPGSPISEEAVSACVTRVRMADGWAMVDAVGARDLGRALTTLADAYDPRERGLPLLGALAWSVRQLARFQAEVAAGASTEEAARLAGAFNLYRTRELSAKARAMRPKEVERWLLVLGETDLALKGSRRPADAVLEDMLTRLCRGAPRPAAAPSSGTSI
jgi:DNA polymerase III subunit delta